MTELEPFGNKELLAIPPWLDRKTGKVREGAHSPLGPSSAHRWFECPGSLRYSWNIISDSSTYADEGTAAHELAAKCLQDGSDAWEHAGEVIKVEGREAGEPIMREFVANEDMGDAVQLYLNVIREAVALDPDAKLFVETKFDLSDIARGVYGTSDAPILLPSLKRLIVNDYKHGIGVAVDVVEKDAAGVEHGNPQLLTYAAGALQEVAAQGYEVAEVELVIVQPRAAHPGGPVRRWTISVAALGEWVSNELVAGVRRAEDPDAPLKMGAWCQFCPAKLYCPAMQKAIAVVEEQATDVVAQLTTDALADRVRKARLLKPYLKALEDELYMRVVKRGEKAPGFKVVEARANRVFKEVFVNPDNGKTETFEKAVVAAFGDDAYEPRSFKSPAQIEKLPTGKAFAAKWAYRKVDNLTLADENDKRNAVKVRTASEAFAGVVNSQN